MKLSIYGLGYRNTDRELSGEDRFCRNLAPMLDAQAEAGEPAVVFDVGANKGVFSAMLDRHARALEVHLFEPHPRTFEQLTANVAAFRCSKVTHNMAVGAKVGRITLYDQSVEGTPFASTLPDSINLPDDQKIKYDVALSTVDVMREGRHIALLKIDVEGAEEAVLEGARESFAQDAISAVFLEHSHLAARQGLSLARLQAMLPGFTLYRVAPDRLVRLTRPDGGIDAWAEVPHYQNVVAVVEDSPLGQQAEGWSQRFALP